MNDAAPDTENQAAGTSQIPRQRFNSWSPDDRANCLCRWLAILGFILVGMTWKLWTPQTSFPQIPFFEFLTTAPVWLDWLGLTGLIAGLAGALIWGARGVGITAIWVFAVAMILLVALDQHRLQPWAFQFFVWAVLLCCCPPKNALRWIRWLTVSIYVYSAVSKLDFQFAQTLGPELLQAVTGSVDQSSAESNSTILFGLALMLPVFELVMGVGLLFRKFTRFALLGIVAMHVALLVILGPFGLNHQWGVLGWNVYLAGQALILFGWINPIFVAQPQSLGSRPAGQSSTAKPQSMGRSRTSPTESLATALAFGVLMFPLTVSSGGADHWIAWEVYAPRTSRCRLEFPITPDVAVKARDQLEYFQVSAPKPRVRLAIEEWSLYELGVPLNPEDRVQFAVAMAMVERWDLENFQISVGGISDRRTGYREWRTVNREDQIGMARGWFRINTRARQLESLAR